ncbi:phosphodiester glycosidase family protein [Agrobacterium vitis]|uniref:phosphodiester glycosidase family protein n=1 Tax=Agrobacterium vitis TaxID=373 RepID=UPI00307E3C9E
MRLKIAVWFFVILSAFAVSPKRVEAAEDNCRDQTENGVAYRICRFDPATRTIRIFNRNSDGDVYGGFDALRSQLWQQRLILTFAVNGGMYHSDLSPVGLFVDYGVTRKPAETADGWGNFYLKPNGVFFLKGGQAGVLETTQFEARKIDADFATQSGPMLVIDGVLNPKFLPASDSLKIRNGVGIDASGQVVFVLSKDPVRFYDMAAFFRDRLGAANALYLDGTISSLAEPMAGRIDRAYPLGPIIAVVDPRPN